MLRIAEQFQRGGDVKIAESRCRGVAGGRGIDITDANADGEAGKDRLGIIEIIVAFMVESGNRRSASSSAAKGSSDEMVAGKKRSPMTPCASARAGMKWAPMRSAAPRRKAGMDMFFARKKR